MHRDLKSANVFLYKNSSAKLGDLNVSKVAKEGLSYTQTGTPYYASPEVWKDQPYDNKSDIWSLGCVLYEAIALKPPFRADDMQGLYKKVLKGVYPKIPSQFSPELSLILRRMLTVNPNKRPSCDDLLEMSSVSKKLAKMFPEEVSDIQNILLSTIRCPKNLMYLTDRLPGSCYHIDDSMNGSDSKTHTKSMHGRTNHGTDSKHSMSFIGSRKTKATSSSNDSQRILPNLKHNKRIAKVASLSKDNSQVLSKRKLVMQKKKEGANSKATIKAKIEKESSPAQEAPRVNNTINPENDEYENDFNTDREETKKSPKKTKHPSSRPEIIKGSIKTPVEDRKMSPYIRKKEVPKPKDEKSKIRTPNYINLNNHINVIDLNKSSEQKSYILLPNQKSKPSERFSKMKSHEEYSNLSGANREKLRVLSNHANYMDILKKKSNRSHSTENHNKSSIDPTALSLRNVRKKDRGRIGTKKNSHVYIEDFKNLSYSPSAAQNLGKNSHTPSLVIRNNYSNNTRNMYHQSYEEYSPYKKYYIKKMVDRAKPQINANSRNEQVKFPNIRFKSNSYKVYKSRPNEMSSGNRHDLSGIVPKYNLNKSRNPRLHNNGTTGNRNLIAGTGLSSSLIPGSSYNV